MRRKHRVPRSARMIVLLFVLTALVGAFLKPTSTDTAQAATPVPPPAVTQKGVTCNTVKVEDVGTCIAKMLSDPNGAYSPDHVYSDAEKQPVRGPVKAAAAAPALGTWSVVADCVVNGFKVNAIHASVTKSGKVLMTAGDGYSKANFDNKVFKTWIWDPMTPNTCPREIPHPAKDLFCSGHSHLQDGRVLFFGGTGKFPTAGAQYYTGIREIYAFDDTTEKFTYLGLMNVARWYPNGPVNSTGNPVITSGLDANGKLTPINEVFSPYTGKSTVLPVPRVFPMYAGFVLIKNGTLFYSGANMASKGSSVPGKWDWFRGGYTNVPGLLYPECRDQANTLLLHPAQAQKVMVAMGGCGQGTTGTTSVVDLNATAPKFVMGPYVGFAAMHACGLVLPDKSAFIAGGGNHNTNPILRAARLPNGAAAWQEVASPTVPRMYHSTCVLLPNGSVLTMGTTAGGTVESRFEIYKPWYMQSGVTRPVFTGSSPVLKQGVTHEATWTGPASIKTASLIKLTSITHSSDPNQRSIDVPVTPVNWGRVKLSIPASGGIIPPGMYMLTLVDWQGIPSESRIVQIVPVKPATAAAGAGGVSAAPAPASCCGPCCNGCC